MSFFCIELSSSRADRPLDTSGGKLPNCLRHLTLKPFRSRHRTRGFTRSSVLIPLRCYFHSPRGPSALVTARIICVLLDATDFVGTLFLPSQGILSRFAKRLSHAPYILEPGPTMSTPGSSSDREKTPSNLQRLTNITASCL